MNYFAYFLIVVGALLFASIGYDEYRGITAAPSGDTSIGVLPDTIIKNSNPEEFHNAIVCHCYFAFGFLSLGILMLIIDKCMDKSDPMSPDFSGNKALDDLAKAMKEVEERQKYHKNPPDKSPEKTAIKPSTLQ
jgi:hypothetical protein